MRSGHLLLDLLFRAESTLRLTRLRRTLSQFMRPEAIINTLNYFYGQSWCLAYQSARNWYLRLTTGGKRRIDESPKSRRLALEICK